MCHINDYEKTMHDKIVTARATQLSLFYRVLADPEIARNSPASGVYPDIIVIDKKNRVIFVETETTVNEESRNDQWIRYSTLKYPFNLIIPCSQILKTKHLIKGLAIHKLFFYLSFPGGIKFYQIHNCDI
jgi:hypothetical protein